MIYTEAIKNVLAITKSGRKEITIWTVASIVFNFALLLPPIATAGIVGVLTNGGEVKEIWMWAGLYVVFYLLYYIPRMIVWRCYRDLANIYHLEIQKK